MKMLLRVLLRVDGFPSRAEEACALAALRRADGAMAWTSHYVTRTAHVHVSRRDGKRAVFVGRKAVGSELVNGSGRSILDGGLALLLPVMKDAGPVALALRVACAGAGDRAVAAVPRKPLLSAHRVIDLHLTMILHADGC